MNDLNDFEKGFLAGFIGYWIGSLIDNTRFGIWFNNNPTVQVVLTAIKTCTVIVIGVLFLYFIFLVMVQMAG